MNALVGTLEKEAVKVAGFATVDQWPTFFNPPQKTEKIRFVEIFEYDLADDLANILPDVDQLITEDDTPVDNIPSEKQQRLLTEPLYSAKEECPLEWPFLAAANVGIFYGMHQPAIVPDMFLSLSVQVSEDWWSKKHRSYFVWEFGKVPELVIEIVSNKEGGEDTTKLKRYGQMGIQYYVIFDPLKLLSDEVLRGYEFNLPTRRYRQMKQTWFPLIGLRLKLWSGEFEGKPETWLRWCDKEGQIIPTGAELARRERQRAQQEQQRAEQAESKITQERQRAEQAESQIVKERQRAKQEQQRAEQAESQIVKERQRIEQLTAKLHELGIDPNSI